MNALRKILALTLEEKQQRGLLHTSREIAQQPATWQQTSQIFAQHRPALERFLGECREQKRTIFLIGAGTSDYIGASFAPLLRQQWGCEVIVAASTSLLTNRDEWLVPDTRYLWISFSRSGDSPEGVAVLEDALEELPDVLHLVVTCNPAGRMAALAAAHVQAYALVLDDAVNDRSLAMTGSFTNMVLVGQLLSLLWNDEDFAPTLEAMATAAEFLLDAGADLASEIAHTQPQRACFIGAGVLAAVARESALKMLELTAGRTLTMSESSLGLRHGPMSALNCNTVLTCFVSNEQRRRSYDLDLLAEVRCRKTTQAIVAIGASANADHTLSCDAFARIPDVFRPPVDVLFGQMLGFFASIEAGLKPDTPSPQGVITRVVQPFAMHR